MASGVVTFVEEFVGVNPGEYTVWYSGGRSIHVHIAAFVDAAGWNQIGQIAAAFNESEGSDVELDTAIYKPKQQFRLPGAEHQENEGLKVKIGSEWSHEVIFSEAHSQDRGTPETFRDVLSETVPPSTTLLHQSDILDTAPTEDDSVEESQSVPVHQQEQPPSDTERALDYYRHNAHPMSPYANADGDDLHSVTIVRVMGKPFERNGTTRVPCDVYGAVGGEGEYEIFRDETGPIQRPVKLSGHDVKKWDYDRTDYVVILGGQSRRSRIFEVGKTKAILAGLLLKEEGREYTLRHFEEWGYDTGSTGMNGTGSSGGSVNLSGAAQLQQKIEQDGIVAIDNEHEALLKVACRLLAISGWNRTWEWFEEQLGPQFDPVETHQKLSAIIDCYAEDYPHVTAPPQPQDG